MVNNHGDRCCPLNGVVGPLINGLNSWLVNRGDPNHLRDPSWDDPPSKRRVSAFDPGSFTSDRKSGEQEKTSGKYLEDHPS